MISVDSTATLEYILKYPELSLQIISFSVKNSLRPARRLLKPSLCRWWTSSSWAISEHFISISVALNSHRSFLKPLDLLVLDFDFCFAKYWRRTCYINWIKYFSINIDKNHYWRYNSRLYNILYLTFAEHNFFCLSYDMDF